MLVQLLQSTDYKIVQVYILVRPLFWKSRLKEVTMDYHDTAAVLYSRVFGVLLIQFYRLHNGVAIVGEVSLR